MKIRIAKALSTGLLAVLLLATHARVAAQEAICAVVKIEIKQELTLERQAFDAEMRIHNALTDRSLENVKVEVRFEDEAGNSVVATSDPNDTGARFFIRVAQLDNIGNVNGSGTVAAQSTAVANWLIVPAPGSATQLTGTPYFVGATLSYTLNGEEETITVAPDRIVVKPQPRLTLDYFLEREVYADNPFTPEIETAEPFTLGVRVSNNGQAPASSVKIESAQPKIVENNQGLVIGFEIISSYVDDKPTAPSLLVDFGRVDPDAAVVGRWQMLTTLSGKFTEFSANFTHADELGGQLTSLLEATRTHALIKDVLVDLPGRDTVLDFLADDGDALRVYESNVVDTEVEDASTSASLRDVQLGGIQEQYELSFTAEPGFSYVRVPDTYNFRGNKVVDAVLRSDGKSLPLANAWFSSTRKGADVTHYFNLFDVNSTGSYTLVLSDKIARPLAPQLQFIPDRTVREGEQLSFLVEASDPNGSIPVITIESLPLGARFALDNTQNNVATYLFDWTPSSAIQGRPQAGYYELNFIATDGVLSSNRRARMTVLSNNDTDNDGMDDQWELDHFGTLDRDGRGDYDNDGISDLDEFLNGSDPASGNQSGPDAPVIERPLYDAHVSVFQPELRVQNVSSTASRLQYSFEVYSDESMSNLVDSAQVNAQLGLFTAHQVAVNLSENTEYFWRVRAYDGSLFSPWSSARFFVDVTPEPPSPPLINAPSDGADVATLTPTLSVMNSLDPDRESLVYEFQVASTANFDFATIVAESAEVAEDASGISSWTVPTALENGQAYYWRAVVTDARGLSTTSAVWSFLVNVNNEAPRGLAIVSPVDAAQIGEPMVDLEVSAASDPEGDEVFYEFEIDTLASFDSANLIQSGQITDTHFSALNLAENTQYFWRVRASDGFASSAWLSARFTVAGQNSAPLAPVLDNPGAGAWVANVTPNFSVNPVVDNDGDAVHYIFAIYSDMALSNLVDSATSTQTTWAMASPLMNNQWYFWRAKAVDEHGAESEWSAAQSFFVDENGIDDAPTLSFIEPAFDILTSANVNVRWNDSDPDSAASIALYYEAGMKGSGGTLIADAIAEDADGPSDQYEWQTEGLSDGDYYLYAVIEDATSTVTVYLNAVITLNRDNSGTNIPPTMTILHPAGAMPLNVEGGEPVSIRWADSDPDDNASIAFYYTTAPEHNNGVLIVRGLPEDSSTNLFDWDTTGIRAGTYYLYAVINDGENAPLTVRSETPIVITANYLDGTEDDDSLSGGADNDVILAGAGNDIVDGGLGDDVLIGGAGNDVLFGGRGADTYVIGLNDGDDEINAVDNSIAVHQRNDRIVFAPDIAPSDIALSINENDLIIRILPTGNTVTVKNHFSPGSGNFYSSLASIDFADGARWSGDHIYVLILNTLVTSGDDIIHGFPYRADEIHAGAGDDLVSGDSGNDLIYGDEGDDKLRGEDGSDRLYGGSGNDVLGGGNGDDVLIGGEGDDTLWGDRGIDTYFIDLGDGSDTIENYDSSLTFENRKDRILFADGIGPDDLRLAKDGNDLLIDIGGSGQSIRVHRNYQVWNGRDYRAILAFIEFADGAVWDIEKMRLQMLKDMSTDFDDVIVGTAVWNDLIDGGAGDDTIRGMSGDDTLIGAEGNDSISGGEGEDRIDGGPGDDILVGDEGDDVIIGGPGNDFMFGRAGSDVFVIQSGEGRDEIRDDDPNAELESSIDTLRMGPGISAASLAFERRGDHLYIAIGSDQSVLIQHHFVDLGSGVFRSRIERVEFADGAFIDHEQIARQMRIAP